MAPRKSVDGPKIVIQARIEQVVLTKLDALAKDQERSRSEMVNLACRDFVARAKK